MLPSAVRQLPAGAGLRSTHVTGRLVTVYGESDGGVWWGVAVRDAVVAAGASKAADGDTAGRCTAVLRYAATGASPLLALDAVDVPPELLGHMVAVRGGRVATCDRVGVVLEGGTVLAAAAPPSPTSVQRRRWVPADHVLQGRGLRTVRARVASIGAVHRSEAGTRSDGGGGGGATSTSFMVHLADPWAVLVVNGAWGAGLRALLAVGRSYVFENVKPCQLSAGGATQRGLHATAGGANALRVWHVADSAPQSASASGSGSVASTSASAVSAASLASSASPVGGSPAADPPVVVTYEGVVTAVGANFLEVDGDPRTCLWWWQPCHLLPPACRVGATVSLHAVHPVLVHRRLVGFAACVWSTVRVVAPAADATPAGRAGTNATPAAALCPPPWRRASVALSPHARLWLQHAAAVVSDGHPGYECGRGLLLRGAA